MQKECHQWLVLFREYLKRDWPLLVCWILGISAFAAGFVPFFAAIDTKSALIGLFETMKNPAMIAITGPTSAKTADAYDLGRMYAQMMLLYSALIAMVVSALFVVAHTRKEEDAGLAEYLSSTQIGRLAPLLALSAEMLCTHLAMTAVTTAIFCAFKQSALDVTGALIFSAGVALGGLLGFSIAALCAQIMPTASAANGLSLGIVIALYLLRALTDISDKSLSLLNPLGRIVFIYPFSKNDASLLLYSLFIALMLLLGAFILQAKRDFGSAYIRQKDTRKIGITSPRSIFGLFLRLNLGTVCIWFFTFMLLGAAYGSIYGDMETFLEGSPLIQAMFTAQGASIEASFTAVILTVLMGIVSILPVVIVNKLATEEAKGRLTAVFATKTSRLKLFAASLSLAICAAVIGALLAAVSLGGVGIAMMDHSDLTLQEVALAALNDVPALLFVLSLAALFVGWMPKWRKFTYVYLTYAFMLTYFQQLLDLPDWFIKTSVFSWLAQMPLDDFKLAPFLGISLVALLVLVLAVFGYLRRDFIESGE